MLNLGMTEIFCFAVIGLLVLGPDKLPEAARFVAKWYGKIKKLINNIQNEIDRELRLSEFREEMQKEIEKISELERRVQKQLDELKNSHASVEEPTQVDSEIKVQTQYLLSKQQTIVPFSTQYQQHIALETESKFIVKKIDPELKIAV
ncbi:Sec-independent protein translocase protein TatB [Acinetobacter sp.]|uniref:Sec-independent protein translocase protein TatB n=1 Tax=Acinetobacter sp. TaxID=472 RepID=UPI0035B0623A